MSDFDANEFLSGVGTDGDGDSDLVRFLRGKVKEAAKNLKTLHDENTAFKSAATKQTLESAWTELKVPEAVRKFYTGEPTADAVKTWFEENKAVFNLGGEQKSETDQSQQLTPEQQAQASQLQAQLQSVQTATTIGTDIGNQLGFDALKAEGAALGQKSALTNMAELDAHLAKLGFGEGGVIPTQMTQ